MHLVNKEKAKYLDQKYNDKDITMTSFERYLQNLISVTGKKTFAVYRIDIQDYDIISKALGQEQLEFFVNEKVEYLTKLKSSGVKVGYEDGSFYVVMKSYDDQTLDLYCKMLVDSMSQKIIISNKIEMDIDVNLSCLIFPNGGDNVKTIKNNLDLTMIDSIKKGKGNFSIYNKNILLQQTEEYEIFLDLKEAIKNKSFTVLYQPIIDVSKMEIYAGEALLRWVHKTKGILSPGTFLHVMEQTGDIIWVGYWLFEQMVKQMQTWKKNYQNEFKLSLNLSLRQLLEPTLAESFRKIALKNQANFDDFIFEIADINAYYTSKVAKENVDLLKKYGFNVAIDNFGDQFEKFARIDELHVDMIKIEKAFWNNLSDDILKKGMLETLKELSKKNNVLLVATWVSNSEDYQKLYDLDIMNMQGYLFSSPLSNKEFLNDVLLTPWAEDIKNIHKQMNLSVKEVVKEEIDLIDNDAVLKSKRIYELLNNKDKEISNEEILAILNEK